MRYLPPCARVNPRASTSLITAGLVTLVASLAGFACSGSASIGSPGTDTSGGGAGAGGASGAGRGGATSVGGAGGTGGSIGIGGTTGAGDAAATTGSGGATGTGGATNVGGGAGTGGSTDAGGTPRADGGAVTGAGGSLGTDAGGLGNASFFIGADITGVQADEARGTTYSDGQTKEIIRLLKDHGFNYVRLRTFVDPRAADGYDKTQGYADIAHTLTFGQRIKAAGMGFLLDFHYSDNWADPGKQCVPIAWQGMPLTQMVQALHDYTKDAITQLVAGGARPDMVQIGNEITPGMLIHICDAGGQPTGNSAVNGSASNWTNLGMFLKAGAAGVREVDPGIKIMLHIDRAGDLQGSANWVTNAVNQGVAFDVFGESSYQLYQGDPASVTNTQATWTNTFNQLASRFPNLKLVAAEYGPMQREINDILFRVPNQLGIGTFNWEPTRQTAGNAGHTLFTTNGNPRTATADLALYDAMKTALVSRLSP
jgi:arabinogalactan endo-1,4-beta-galactosidase